MSKFTHKLLCATIAGAFALAGSTHAQTAPDDAQIAGIVVAANQVDIDAGKLAQKTTKQAEVKSFAKQMVTDHTGVNKQAGALVKKLKVTPADSDLSKSLKAGGAENIAKLRTLKGKDFDKAYVDHEVAYHQSVIDALDKTLIPNAKNAELKDTLVKTRPAFVAHLEHAKQLQSTMLQSTPK
jgi:putative membrane protein